MQRRNRDGRWLVFTRGLIDKLLSFIISGRTTYTAATRHLSADVLSFGLRRQDVVKVGTAAIKTLRIPAETARCPICGPSPEFVVIDAQSLGCSDPDDTVPFRPAEDCPVLNIPAPKLCVLEHAPLRAAVTKVLRTSAPLTAPQVALLRAWHNQIGAAGRPSPEAAAAEVFFRFFPLGREQPASADAGSGGAQDNAAPSTDTGRPAKRGRFEIAGGGLEASLRLDKDGAVVLGGKGPPAKKTSDTWRNRKGLCAPDFDRYPRDDDGLWICVRPFLQAMLTETVSGIFQAFDERAVRLLANTLRLMRRGVWRSLTKAVDGVGFVAGFLGWFADLIDEEQSLRQAVGVLLVAVVDVEKYVDDTFLSVATNKSTLAAGWKNDAYCTRWRGRPTTADYKQWRAEQSHLQDMDEDDPLVSFEYFAGLPRVRPGIVDSAAAKRRVQYRGKDRHKADLEGEGDACNKAFSIKAGLTQGVFNVVCPHVITLGFRCLFRAESVGEALSIVLERFAKLPKAIFYDVACKLDKNAMRRVRPLMRAQSVRCILDRPHSITHSCSPTYMPDECLGTTAGVATQAAEVSHSIAVVNRTSLAYMSPATYMYHRMVQVAFMNLRKLYRLHADNGVGENDHVPLAPFFHSKISHQCERVTVCTCASAASTDGGKDAAETQTGLSAVPAGGPPGAEDRADGAEAVAGQGPAAVEAHGGLADGPIPVFTGARADAAGRGSIQNGSAGDKADRMMVMRHTMLLADFNSWAAARSTRNQAPLATQPVTRAQRKLIGELTSRPLAKAVRPRNKARILLCGSDYNRLRGEAWLNDEMMNSFAALINHRSAAHLDGVPPSSGEWMPLRAVMFNTYFYSRLSARSGCFDYHGVRRWGVKLGLDLTAIDVILVPVNLSGMHWVLGAIDVRRREFHFYDSLSAVDVHGTIPLLKRWLHDEVDARLGQDVAADWQVSQWRTVLDPNQPQQGDGGSCGVFVLAAADCLSLGAPLAFSQVDIASLRYRVGLSLFFDDLHIPDDIPHPNSVSGTATPVPSDDEAIDLQAAVEEEDGYKVVEADDDGEEDGEEGEGEDVYDAESGDGGTGVLGGENGELEVEDMEEREDAVWDGGGGDLRECGGSGGGRKGLQSR